jgi:hypothetical protein
MQKARIKVLNVVYRTSSPKKGAPPHSLQRSFGELAEKASTHLRCHFELENDCHLEQSESLP